MKRLILRAVVAVCGVGLARADDFGTESVSVCWVEYFTVVMLQVCGQCEREKPIYRSD